MSIFLTSPLPLAWKGTPAVFFSCWAVSVAKTEGKWKDKSYNLHQFYKDKNYTETSKYWSRERLYLLMFYSNLHFCRSSALRVALFGFLFSWKCFTGGVRGPTRVVNALLFKYWHSRGSMADASHSLTKEKSIKRDEGQLNIYLDEHSLCCFICSCSVASNVFSTWFAH